MQVLRKFFHRLREGWSRYFSRCWFGHDWTSWQETSSMRMAMGLVGPTFTRRWSARTCQCCPAREFKIDDSDWKATWAEFDRTMEQFSRTMDHTFGR